MPTKRITYGPASIESTRRAVADFFKETEKLAKKVGDGTLSGIFAVDGGGRTVPLEVGYWRNHMGRNGHVDIRNYTDGEAHAIQHSLEATYLSSLEDIAKTALASGPQEGMTRHVNRVDEQFKIRAPKRTGQYRNSAARFVIDNGVPVHESFDSHYGDDPGA
jgi:hypothetical protein